jgi:hypothetical protein
MEKIYEKYVAPIREPGQTNLFFWKESQTNIYAYDNATYLESRK